MIETHVAQLKSFSFLGFFGKLLFPPESGQTYSIYTEIQTSKYKNKIFTYINALLGSTCSWDPG